MNGTTWRERSWNLNHRESAAFAMRIQALALMTLGVLVAGGLVLAGCGGASPVAASNDGSPQALSDGNVPPGSGGAPGTGGVVASDGAQSSSSDGSLGQTGGAPADAPLSQGGAGGAGGAALDVALGADAAGGTSMDSNTSQGEVGGPAGKDGPVGPVCGDPGTACCSSNTCKAGGCCVSGICMSEGATCVGLGGTCSAGSCGTCGGPGLPCCGPTPSAGTCTAPATKCTGGTCSKCGDLGLPCCTDANGAGTCNGANTLCSNNLCVSCGAPGTACCPGNLCASPGCCYGNTCVGEGSTCGTTGGACAAGRCSGCGASGQGCCTNNVCYDGLSCKGGICGACGHTGESCCAVGAGSGPCQAGTTCTSPAADGICARCGGLGDVCCAGDTCADGCCSGGRCLTATGTCTTGSPGCGNGVLSADETCDDGNTVGGDGCSADCRTVEAGWECRVPGKRCVPRCGDGALIGGETCDDGNSNSGDGCSSTCQIEPGAACPTPGKACTLSACGNGIVEVGELCDLGAKNGLFYGDGKGCSKTCTKEPNCRDSLGHNQACDVTCGDGHLDPGEECDDGNLNGGDGCSSTCTQESGFSCTTATLTDSTTCSSGTGQCLQLPVIYRDFLPENVSGGHPDFFWLGTQTAGQVSRWCVPNSGGPAKGSDATARCWDLVATDLVAGKPQYNTARADNLCACQFSDWNLLNSTRIAGGYTQAESPLYDPVAAAYRTGVTYTTTNNVPTWKGQVPIVTSAASFSQWFNDDATVNTTYAGAIELGSIGTNVYQYASKSHLMAGGFFPLDSLGAAQKTLCNMWPYWHAWTTCAGDQYLFPPRVVQADCPTATSLKDGCWVTSLTGQTHDNYFTEEARYLFVYDGTAGINLQFYGDDDLFIFINGKLVLDLGGVHQQLPGKVTVSGSPGDATVTEGGCLDSAGNITGVTAGSTACSPVSSVAPTAKTPDDFRTRTVTLGLVTGRTYEIAIFGADRHPPESNFQLTLNGYATKRSVCTPRCGDGIVSAGEECDAGPQNSDTTYGGCTTKCKFGPFCGDGIKNGTEGCDLGKQNGDATLGKDGCTAGCTKPHYCGDGIVDAALDEACDLGANNGQPGFACSATCTVVP